MAIKKTNFKTTPMKKEAPKNNRGTKPSKKDGSTRIAKHDKKGSTC